MGFITIGTVIDPSASTSYVVFEIVMGPSVLTVRPYDAVKSSSTFTLSPNDRSSSPLILTDDGPELPPVMTRTSSPVSFTDAAPSSALSFDGGVVVTI